MGAGDFNLDGNLDIFKTHFAEDTPVLYANRGRGGFQDVTFRAGLGVETRFVTWGTGIVDLDNDGYPDLFLVTDNVYRKPKGKWHVIHTRRPRLLSQS